MATSAAASSGRVALVTGLAGQDGAWLSKLLLEKGYLVTGTARNLAPSGLWRLEELGIRDHPRLRIVSLDVGDADRCLSLVSSLQPDETYNLAGLSFIGQSFSAPLDAFRTTGMGAANLLEALRTTCRGGRFFQASSSELFGNAPISPQDERTPLSPRSPYAVAKAFAHWASLNYSESFGMFASSGILYNHESHLRGADFVTRKITRAVARISKGLQECVELGNLDAKRDWGYAPEYADAMWRMLQAPAPNFYVIATGRLASVREFVQAAFSAVDITIHWRGTGLDEEGVSARDGRVRVKVVSEYYRPLEKTVLLGNPDKIRRELGWRHEKQMEEICRLMVEADLGRIEKGA